MLRTIALGTLFLCSICASAFGSPTVDCDAGQSLNRTLAKIDKITLTFTFLTLTFFLRIGVG